MSNKPNATRSTSAVDMVKRPAEESLEEVLAQASKKSRVEAIHELRSAPKRSTALSEAPTQDNENKGDGDERNGNGAFAGTHSDEEDHLEDASAEREADDLNDQSAYSATARQQVPVEGYSDLYLDTINRSVLDFDFEKLCSVTLSNINVYACLVCGKYYQGRGPKSHAYFHALEVGHHVYVNMQTKRVYVLPEGYEVKSKSLDDIKFVVDPNLSKEEVALLDREAKDAWDLSGKKYRPGMLFLGD